MLAAPDKLCVYFMGDAAFGMVGLDFETLVRAGIPILAIVLNDSTMAIESRHMVVAQERYRTRDIGGDYTGIARSLGMCAERVERPDQLRPAIHRARRLTEDGSSALIECITSAETAFSHETPLRIGVLDSRSFRSLADPRTARRRTDQRFRGLSRSRSEHASIIRKYAPT
jgi:thiamine pyrophosphate-dependent acetolactate synthase large subunit-like protein